MIGQSRLSKITLTLAVGFLMGGCRVAAPPFESGVRVQTFEELGYDQSTALSLGGVGNYGNVTAGPFGHGTGTITNFGPSLTDPRTGVSDYPNAATDANWSATADYTPVMPECHAPGTNSPVDTVFNYYVPAGGTIFKFTCHL